MPPSPTSSRWVFTLNNFTDGEVDHVRGFLTNQVYAIFGRESAPDTGTPHLQGFLILPAPQRLSYLRHHLSARAHFETAKRSSQHNRDYCRKEGDYEEFGTFPERQGKRSDLDEYIAWADTFTAENGRPPSSPEIAKHQPAAYLKYPRFKHLVHHRAPVRQLEFGEPNEWQRELEEELIGEADDRMIKFVVDNDGGKGKTWFCRWFLTNHPEKTQILGIGKKHDLAFMVDETKTVFLFNVGRLQMEYLSYGLLEAIKDRMVISTKYHGVTKFLAKSHVVVFSNESPDQNKLTRSRFDIHYI